MALYKFLEDVDGQRPRGRFSDFLWPVPKIPGGAEWVVTTPPLEVCRRGIHVCRPGDLAHWLDDELWEVEVAGQVVEEEDKVVVERARLLGRVEGWPTMAAPFRDDCVRGLLGLAIDIAREEGMDEDAEGLAARGSLSSIREAVGSLAERGRGDIVTLLQFLADASDYARLGETAIVAFIVAHAADRVPLLPGRRLPRGLTPFDVERRRQASWLQSNLGLV